MCSTKPENVKDVLLRDATYGQINAALMGYDVNDIKSRLFTGDEIPSLMKFNHRNPFETFEMTKANIAEWFLADDILQPLQLTFHAKAKLSVYYHDIRQDVIKLYNKIFPEQSFFWNVNLHRERLHEDCPYDVIIQVLEIKGIRERVVDIKGGTKRVIEKIGEHYVLN